MITQRLFNFLLSMLLISSTAFSAPSKPEDRIDPKLAIIQEFVEQSKGMSKDRRIEYFDNERLRDQLRDLQNLFKLYGYTHKGFKKMYKKAKKFEDNISHFRDVKWNRGDGGMGDDMYATQKAKYDKFLENSSWFEFDESGQSKMIGKIKALVEETDLGSIEADRDVLLDGFAAKLTKLSEKELDLVHTLESLQEKDKRTKYDLVEYNIHEVRRDARRIRYLNYGTVANDGGLIQRSMNVPCPMGQEVGTQNYTLDQYHPNENYKCYVSSCLMDYLDSKNSQFSSLRGSGFRHVKSLDDVRLKSTFDEAKAKFDQLHEDKVYLHLAHQIKLCKSRPEVDLNNPEQCNDNKEQNQLIQEIQ